MTSHGLVNMVFADEIGKTMEVYVDGMLIKSVRARDHVYHPDQMFNIARKYGMKLNPLNCTFGVRAGKFLGFNVHQRGIKVNPEKIQALLDIKAPKSPKEVQN